MRRLPLHDDAELELEDQAVHVGGELGQGERERGRGGERPRLKTFSVYTMYMIWESMMQNHIMKSVSCERAQRKGERAELEWWLLREDAAIDAKLMFVNECLREAGIESVGHRQKVIKVIRRERARVPGRRRRRRARERAAAVY